MRISVHTKKRRWVFISGEEAEQNDAIYVQLVTGDLTVAPPEEEEYYEEEEEEEERHRRRKGPGSFGFAPRILS